MKTIERKKWLLVAGSFGLLCAYLALPAAARALAPGLHELPRALETAPLTPERLATLQTLPGSTQVAPTGIQPHEGGNELVAWWRLQNHLKRVEVVCGVPYTVGPGGSQILSPDGPAYILVRTFESPHDHAPLAEPLLDRASLRLADNWGNEWYLPLHPIAQNSFGLELVNPALVPWASLFVEALAWSPGSPAVPGEAYYRSLLLGP